MANEGEGEQNIDATLSDNFLKGSALTYSCISTGIVETSASGKIQIAREVTPMQCSKISSAVVGCTLPLIHEDLTAAHANNREDFTDEDMS